MKDTPHDLARILIDSVREALEKGTRHFDIHGKELKTVREVLEALARDKQISFEPKKVPPCRCNCGYRCGGPGHCKLPPLECLRKNDKKHFVRDCDHVWDGPAWESHDGCISSVTCSRCGVTAIGHDSLVGP